MGGAGVGGGTVESPLQSGSSVPSPPIHGERDGEVCINELVH